MFPGPGSTKKRIQQLIQRNNLSIFWCDEALELIRKAKEEYHTKLDLGWCWLKVLPDELFELTWLEELSLSNNAYVFSFEENDWVGGIIILAVSIVAILYHGWQIRMSEGRYNLSWNDIRLSIIQFYGDPYIYAYSEIIKRMDK